MHKSLSGFWWLLEFLPKRAKWREWKRLSLLGFYIPRGEPRRIEPGFKIDRSVAIRRYKPVNLP